MIGMIKKKRVERRYGNIAENNKSLRVTIINDIQHNGSNVEKRAKKRNDEGGRQNLCLI